MQFLIQQTLIYAVPLMLVALAGVCAERSGTINLALEGIMIFGAFIGVMSVRVLQGIPFFTREKGQLVMLIAMAIAAIMGGLFSLLLAFSAINLKADQTIGGTALNMLAPAVVLFLIVLICHQNSIGMLTGASGMWFAIRPATFGLDPDYSWGIFD
ncbi:MAG: ABC transporter permease, partial [Clostridia bacterium]|nr:ABC transporter permease [Clostridia bacterium]